MPAGHRERKVEFITIKTHGKQNRLYSLMSQLRNSKSCVIQQIDHIRSPFQSANCIGRIIITMMKSTSIFLERTGKSQSRAATIINPPGERLQILKFFRCIFHHQYTCNTPRSLSIKRVHIDTIHLRFRINLINYGHPNRQAIPNFKDYFATYAGQLKLRPYQTLHFELGRAVVGQCGTLISKVLYVKQGAKKKFAILDAGMTDLIRPALYQAYHKMENLTSEEPMEAYDVVGPICESSDVFGKAIDLNKVKRGDLIALRSAGAYGEIMASGYNCRELPKGYTSDELL